MAAEVAGQLSQCRRIVMVSQGDSDIGASKLTGEVLDIVGKVHGAVAAMTGHPANITVSGDTRSK